MGKSSKHKKDNVHHFVSFNERISSVNVDVIHQIRKVDTNEDEITTHFGEALGKWTDLDLTEHFTTFRAEISGQVRTFEQLVHHKDDIIAALKTHLAVKNSTALNALLDLLVQLSQDLQQDFVPHFPEFFTILVNILTSRPQDAEALEATFQSLAFLFRSLWRFLIKDFEEVFRYFSQLLSSSQKDYIKVFAAESCAYLLRKVKKKNELLNFLFKSLKTTPELTEGVGLLLFEMVKGVKSHFHTTSKEIFPLILQKLGPPKTSGVKGLPMLAVEEAVTIFMQECADHSNKENCKELWNILLDTILKVFEEISSPDKEIQKLDLEDKVTSGQLKHLARLLKLMSFWVIHNNGSVVSDSEKIAQVIIQILKSAVTSEALGSVLLDTVAKLLSTCQGSLSVGAIFKLTSAVFAVPFKFPDLKAFVKELIDAPFFEKDILPGTMSRINAEVSSSDNKQKEEAVVFVIEILKTKLASPETGDDLNLLKAYPLDKSWTRQKQENAMVKYISDTISAVVEDSENSLEKLSQVFGALYCCPHFSVPGSLEKLSQLWDKLSEALKSCTDKELKKRMCFILNQLMRSILTIHQASDNVPWPVDCVDIAEILACEPTNPFLLQTVDLILSHPSSSTDLLTETVLVEIYRLVKQNLASPSHCVRLLTCHILSLFPVQLKDLEDGVERDSIFKSMLLAERLTPTVHNYREKLMHLRKMDHGMAMKCIISDEFCTGPLLFLLGNTHWHFKLLWAPLIEIVTSHAHGLELDIFWGIMLKQLKIAAKEAGKASQSGHSNSDEPTDHVTSLKELVEQEMKDNLTDSRQTDYINYRIQLWKTLQKFPEVCVYRSDELCDLFLDFIKNEFNNADDESQTHQNIQDQSSTTTATTTATETTEEDMEVETIPPPVAKKKEKTGADDDDDDEEDDDDDVAVAVQGVDKATIVRRNKISVGSLLAKLQLFALFKKQRSKLNQTDVQAVFFELLKNRMATVQKAAFDVILTYKSPHILPYRENFERLLDDKTFKSEIVLFRVDEDTSMVKESDREGILPVLMRILYGKMNSKAGKDTSGKSRSLLRKSTIFGFLSGCKPQELTYFLELLFKPCEHFVSDDPVSAMKDTIENVDLQKMIPLKKIKGILNTVNTVLRQLGHRLGDFKHRLYLMLVGLCAVLNSALAHRDQVIKGAVNLLKSLRHITMNKIIQFFEYYTTLDFTRPEIESLFVAAVWPQLDKLVLEGVHFPTPLLNLFLTFSRSQRLRPLLTYNKTDGQESSVMSPLSSMFALLNAPTVNVSVATVILNIVDNLLNLEEEEEDEETPLPEPFTFPADIEKEKAGEAMLLPFIPNLLQYLKGAMKKLTSRLSQDKTQSYTQQAKILARVSSFVTSEEECGVLCELLIPYLSVSDANFNQELEENILMAVSNLMQHVKNPLAFYRPISKLFMSVERRESRNLLCKLFKVVNKDSEGGTKLGVIIEKLNSWDKNKAEEPDYIKRLSAFQEVNSAIMEQEVDIDILIPIVCNCCFFIRTVDDLSVRDTSTYNLVCIVKRLATTAAQTEGSQQSIASKAFHHVLEQCLIPQVKSGIRNKSEAVRHEFLAVWQSLVQNYPDHQLFAGLKLLMDKDLDADFFENIRHIQIHKRSRALRRLYRHLRNHKMNADIHMSYFIPLIYSFILDTSYSKHADVQDAAVDLLGAICKQLPWHHYLQLLQFYLKLLPRKVETQRQIIRIIVALLDSFHFDLRNSTFIVTNQPKLLAKNSDDKDYDQIGEDKTETAKEAEEEDVKEPSQEEILPDLAETIAPSTDVEMAEVVEEEKDGKDSAQEGPAVDNGKLICSAAAATRIHRLVVTVLLPQLQKVVTQKAKSEDQHKSVRSKYPEDDEILRVPIALAMIKLLQNLPKGTLENRLPGILLKICHFLKSYSRDIRTTARDTLEKAALSLGPRFIVFIIKEMQSVLTRGYQLHILSFTTFHLLKGLLPVLSPGDLDPAVPFLQSVFHNELFGQVAEEKDVAAIKTKFFEAKFVKAYDAYELMAKNVSAKQLQKVIDPVKEILHTTSSQRVAAKAEAVLKKVADGLLANNSIPLEAMMVFINSLTTKQMDFIIEPKISAPAPKQDDVKSRLLPESCLLLEKAIPRDGVKPKASKKTNSHVLVEFGLQLLNAYLKKSALLPTEHAHLQMLDPLVPMIKDCLSSVHVKCSAGAMRCISWMLRFPLPSLKANISDIAKGMFVVLKNYAGASTAKGANQELISMCFKAVTVLVREVEYFQISTEQLQVLLTYCEEDLYNFSRQSTAFNLIRAILSRKLDVPQLHEVVGKLFEMSITASTANTRLQCRQVLLFYLMNYPLGKDLRQHLSFYIDNLQFELEDGREAAIEMMISMFTNFPQKILNNHCDKFFPALSMAFYNDYSVKCRKLISVALKSLIGKINGKRRKFLFTDVLKWMKSDDVRVQAMGCQVCGMVSDVEGGKFIYHLPEVLPVLQKQLDPSNYQNSDLADGEMDQHSTNQQDMCLLSALTTTLKIMRELNVVRNAKFQTEVDLIWGHVLSHLNFPHTQVRLAACQLLGFMFSACDPTELALQAKEQVGEDAENVENGEVKDDDDDDGGDEEGEEEGGDGKKEKSEKTNKEGLYLGRNTSKKIKKFGMALCKQMHTPVVDDALATQIIKNLLYLGSLAEAMNLTFDLTWLAKRVMREANLEVIHNVKVIQKRTFAFKWVAAIGVTLKPETVQSLLPVVLPALLREMAEHAQDGEMKSLAQEVVDVVKKQVGVEVFTMSYAQAQRYRLEKRDDRKRKLAAEVVTDPELAARKKISKHLKKKEARKRKFEEKKKTGVKKKVKKSKLSVLNVQVEDDD